MLQHLELISDVSPVWFIQEKPVLKWYIRMLAECNESLIVSQVKIKLPYPVKEMLLENSFIETVRGGFKMGNVSESEVHLFVNVVNPLVGEYTLIRRIFDEYKNRVTKKSFVITAGISLCNYLEDAKNIKGNPDVMFIWQHYLTLIYNKESRSLTGKEQGQFGHLIRMYGLINAVKMVILYLTESSSPNIGELLIKKDKYYHRFVSKHSDDSLKTSNHATGENGGFS